MSLRLPTHPGRATRMFRDIAAAAVLPVLVVGCSVTDTADSDAADTITVTEQWAKAADSGMSAAFGTVHNSGSSPVTITSASSTASARVELHEVATDTAGSTVMRPKAGGFVIPAGAALDLKPAGEHLMFMELHGPLRTGTQAPITLTFDDGSSTTFTAGVRDFAGNQENYDPDHEGEHSG